MHKDEHSELQVINSTLYLNFLLDNNSFKNETISMYEIKHYVITESGVDVFLTWLQAMKDTTAKVATIRRVARIELGNFGDHKFCRDGVWEMRVDVGAGYRVYYAIAGEQVVLLLCGGDKKTQVTDIDRACENWKIWKKENQK